jgi:non-canonical purine NTP pyrophosphatase (RdgB/HAM1 family)
MKLLIATANPNKLREFAEILGCPENGLRSALDYPQWPEVEEDGATFAENASKKALEWVRRTGGWAMADDSGLEVDALGGAPGVLSARYAGTPSNSEANNRKLLEALRGQTDRRARFRCVIALADPSGTVRLVEDACEGAIAQAPRGREGFGYDPLFIPLGSDRTFAELPAEEKHRLSHRGKALAQARRAWREWLQSIWERDNS